MSLPTSTSAAEDPFDLARFLEAQARDYPSALAELRAGKKRTHWIWYVLPQLRGLGRSRLSDFYGIGSLAEAQAYAAHPVLGARLLDCVQAIARHDGKSAAAILGSVDAAKYRSCLTLFKRAAGPDSVFAAALVDLFDGREDQATLDLLAAGPLPA